MTAVAADQVDAVAVADGVRAVGAGDVDVEKKGHARVLQLHLDEVVLAPMGAAAALENFAAV